MADRQRAPLPFGNGLDRASGGMVVRPDSFADLRNVSLVQGRFGLRRGAARAILFGDGTDVLGIWPIRAQAVAAAIIYDSISGDVMLYNVDATGTIAVYVDTLYTLAAGAQVPPQIICADAYDKLIIAHAEPLYSLREDTLVYDPTGGTLVTLDVDFGRTGSPEPAKFYGVARHLAYMLGWGYGQQGAGDSGYTLRISLPGDPTNFVPEHYFQVGAKGDAIIGGGPCGPGFAVQKSSSSFMLAGYDRATFRIEPLDASHGLVGPRLHASVNGEHHFWSESGPRYSNGGPSAHLALPLAIDGPEPTGFDHAVNTDAGFAYHDPIAGEIVYVFGTWGYAFHLKDGDRRWSFRKFAVPLASAGKLYIGGEATLTVPSWPLFASASSVEPAVYSSGTPDATLTVHYTIGGVPAGTEVVELWIKPSTSGVWTRIATGPASALVISGLTSSYLTAHDIALRFTIGGLPGAGYSSTNPATWTATALGTHTTVGPVHAWDSGLWHRYDALTQGLDSYLEGPGTGQAGGGTLSFRVERSLDNVTWVAHGVYSLLDLVVLPFANAQSASELFLRIRAEGPAANSAWLVMAGTRWIGPEQPAFTYLDAALGLPFGGNDHHDLWWGAPDNVRGVAPDLIGPYEYQTRHVDVTPAVGAWHALVGAAAGATSAPNVQVPVSITVTPRYAEVWIRVNDGTDHSRWTSGISPDEP